jgi:hypothetical protein
MPCFWIWTWSSCWRDCSTRSSICCDSETGCFVMLGVSRRSSRRLVHIHHHIPKPNPPPPLAAKEWQPRPVGIWDGVSR